MLPHTPPQTPPQLMPFPTVPQRQMPPFATERNPSQLLEGGKCLLFLRKCEWLLFSELETCLLFSEKGGIHIFWEKGGIHIFREKGGIYLLLHPYRMDAATDTDTTNAVPNSAKEANASFCDWKKAKPPSGRRQMPPFSQKMWMTPFSQKMW